MDIHGSSKSTFISDQVYPYIRYYISVHLLNSSMWLIRFKESQHFLVRSDQIRSHEAATYTLGKYMAQVPWTGNTSWERLGWSHRANCKLQTWNSKANKKLQIARNCLGISCCVIYPGSSFQPGKNKPGRPAWPRQTNEHRSHFGQEFEPASEETFQTRFAV